MQPEALKTAAPKGNSFGKSFVDAVDRIMSKSYNQVLYYVLFTILLSVHYYTITPYTNYAFFGGDTWEYQSLAVNFAKGHGIDRFGAIEQFEEYKFGGFDQFYDGSPEMFHSLAGTQNSYRTPVYPLFLGIIYKIFGVNVLIAKFFQLLLYVLIAASLPIIGYRYLSVAGFLGGKLAAIVFLERNAMLANELMTEPVTSFVAFLVILAFMLYTSKRNTFSAILLGLSFGLAWLTKGSLVFIPVFIGLYIFFKGIKEKQTYIHSFIIVVFMALVITPWSVFASNNAHKFVLLSTQGPGALYDGNNEFSTGDWAPQWNTDSTSFYNTDGMSEKSPALRVANFYLQNPGKIIELPSQKLVRGFLPFQSIWYFMAALLLHFVFMQVRWFHQGIYARYLKIALTLMVFLWLYATYNKSFDIVYNYFVEHAFLFSILLAISSMLYIKYATKLLQLHPAFGFAILNYIVITLIFLAVPMPGGSRYVVVIDYVFLYLAFVIGVQFLKHHWVNTPIATVKTIIKKK